MAWQADRLPLRAQAALVLALAGTLPAALAAQTAASGSSIEAAAVAPEASPGRGAVTSLPIPRFVSLRADSANARRGPGLDQRIDWEFVHRGMPLRITAEYGQWRRVEDAEGLGGWVHQALLSGARTGVVAGADAVPLLARPEAGSATRAVAEPGAILRLDRCRSGWCEVQASGLDGWLPEAAIWGVEPGEEFD